MHNKSIRIAASIAVLLALFVVMLGAYTRLTDAGLGCPDWPGCYGQMVLPSADASLQEAQTKYPQIPIEARKAWTEMAHRYAAGTLGLLILFLLVRVLRSCYQGKKTPWRIPVVLILLVLFQAALGMWTVTLKLLPVVVMTHLLGGILIFACLSRFRLQLSSLRGDNMPQWRPWFYLGCIVVFLQIALGGWVSANYAGISCIGFPQCNGIWFPELHFSAGFNLFSSVGANYQGGLLENDARISIQFIHRLGAVLTAAYLLILSFVIVLKANVKNIKAVAVLIILLVLIQFILGILNVTYMLPLFVAVAHNGIAALLFAAVFSLLHFSRKGVDYAC